MNNSNYMSNRNHFKDIGSFISKKLLIPSHVTRNELDDPQNSKMFCTYFFRIFLVQNRGLYLLKWLRYGQSYKFHVL